MNREEQPQEEIITVTIASNIKRVISSQVKVKQNNKVIIRVENQSQKMSNTSKGTDERHGRQR